MIPGFGVISIMTLRRNRLGQCKSTFSIPHPTIHPVDSRNRPVRNPLVKLAAFSDIAISDKNFVSTRRHYPEIFIAVVQLLQLHLRPNFVHLPRLFGRCSSQLPAVPKTDVIRFRLLCLIAIRITGNLAASWE